MPNVVVIGWDGACWSRIHPLLDAGAMPNLARLVGRGVMGNLATPPPVCPSALWTSLATGQLADRHGVLDIFEPDARTGGVRPVSRASLCVPPVWEMLAKVGVRCRTVGWPVTHPARGPAVCVSDGFARGMRASFWPVELESRLGELRFDPQEWTVDELRLFVPGLAAIDEDKDRGLAKLAVLLAEATSVQAAATTLMEEEPAELTAVWFGVVGAACEAFGDDSSGLYSEVVNGVYRYLDMMLGRLVELAGPEALVMLVSDRAAAEQSIGPPVGGALQGIFAAAGPGIEPDELAFGANVLDVAPTVLGLFGYAPNEGMVGRAIPEICGQAPVRAMEMAAEPPVATAADELRMDVEVAALAALGYKDVVEPPRKALADQRRKQREFNLAWVLAVQGRLAEAVPLLEELSRKDPQHTEMRLYLAYAYYLSRRLLECRELCEQLRAEFPDSPLAPIVMAMLAIAEGKADEAQAELARGGAGFGMAAELDGAIGELYLRIGKVEHAIAAFESALRTDGGSVTAREGLARALLAGGRHEEAAEAAMDAIRVRFDQPSAHVTLGRALQAMGRDEDAARALAFGERLSRKPVAA